MPGLISCKVTSIQVVVKSSQLAVVIFSKMIEANRLQFLINQKMADSRALFRAGRYATAIYIMGYAIEIALKKRICYTCEFPRGFPENEGELRSYTQVLQSFVPDSAYADIRFSSIRDIRNHDLLKLLKYSGREYYINLHYLQEWTIVNQWHPAMRYMRKLTIQQAGASFLKSARIIIHQLS